MSAFTKKHYDAISRVLSNLPDDAPKANVVFALGRYFEQDNRRFKFTRFQSASLYPKETKGA